jgi:HEAT repeat protein
LDYRTPAKTLLELAKENEDVDYSSESDLWQFDTSLAICVASNVGAPDEVLRELLTQDKLRQTIARNPNCTLEILQELTKDADLAVRRNVARNPCASLEILEQLANDVEEDVRSAVASNPKSLPAVLKILANDESERVRTCAYYNIGASDEVRALAVLNGIEEKSDDFAEIIKFLRNKTRQGA